MAVIEKNIKLEGSKGERDVFCLFDAGATYSCIQPEWASFLGRPEALPRPMEFGTAKESEKVIASERISLNFYLDGFCLSDEFMLIPSLSEQAIIGSATLQKWRLKLDFEHDEVIIDPRVTKLRLILLRRAKQKKQGSSKGEVLIKLRRIDTFLKGETNV